jgi:adenylyltransferase/sulfurtransferase
MDFSRYSRQTLLPNIGASGQQRLAESRVLLIGCGGLGCVIADQLVRAGVGFLRIADRDIVETSNLHRQILFDEHAAQEALPKPIAAARQLGAINSSVIVEAQCVDVHSGNIEGLAEVNLKSQVHLLVDATDNIQTRYLINDVSVKHGIPWIYGGAIGFEGRVMTIRPGHTACLRCLYPEAPAAGSLPTCDTVGILGSAAAAVGSLQAIAAIKLLTGNTQAIAQELLVLDFWGNRLHRVNLAGVKRADCPACGRGRLEFLEACAESGAVTLCGGRAVQVRPPGQAVLDLEALADRLKAVGEVRHTPFFVRCQLGERPEIVLRIFPDGRALIDGISDLGTAQAIYARYIGV